MLGDNLVYLRKVNNLSQEELADSIGVSRQTLSKWETGESAPDIMKSKQLAEIFGVSLDDLVSFNRKDDGFPIPPKGKHIFGLVKVGEKGQIVLPAKARKIFKIEPGDEILVLGDEGQGIALVKSKSFLDMIENLRNKN